MNPVKFLDMYSWMILVLSVFSVAGAYTFGVTQVLPQILIAVAAANAFDIAAKYFKTRELRFTKTATITGLFIGQLLPLSAEFYLPLAAAAVAIASKHLINISGRHLFNPALFSMLVIALVFSSLPSWWGSFAFPTDSFPAANTIAVAVLGILITVKMKRFGVVWPFVVVYLVGGYLTGYIQDLSVSSLMIDSTVLYAVFFMLMEPKTSPFLARPRMIYSAAAAVVFLILNLLAPEYNLIGAILVANAIAIPLDRTIGRTG